MLDGLGTEAEARSEGSGGNVAFQQLFHWMGHDAVPNMHRGVGSVGRTDAVADRQHSRSILTHNFYLMKLRIQWKALFVWILTHHVVPQVSMFHNRNKPCKAKQSD